MPVSHPTILIGYGSYGQTALRRLLEHAASRGTLSWEGATTREGQGSRRLQNLSLLCIAKDPGVENLFSNDLQLQIETIWPSEQDLEAQNSHHFIRDELKRAAVAARNRMLNTASRAQKSRGLDVMVVAHASEVAELGALEASLLPAMNALADDPSLRSPGPGQDLLNFTLLLDFDHYWQRSAEAKTLRTETSKFADRWQERKTKGLPSFGRLYLSDGYSQNGHRNREQRIDESTLFLEFALFEGLRDQPGLQRMYQAEQGSGIVASFGIRVIENNRGLLSKLAAARFACGWLEYLGESHVPGDQGVLERLSQELEPFRPRALEEAAPSEELSQYLAKGLDALEAELLALALGKGWVRSVHDRLAEGRLRLKTDLANWAGRRMQETAAEKLKDLRASLEEIVTSALHDRTAPAPLGAVLRKLKELHEELEQANVPPAAQNVSPDVPSDQISEAYREYEQFVTSQLDVEGNRTWWPLLGLVLAAVWTPIVIDGVEEFLPAQDDSSWVPPAVTSAATWLNKPSLLIPAAVVLVWWGGYRFVLPWLRRRIARGRQWFDHPERGLLADRVRAAVRAGSFREGMDAYAANLRYEMVQRLSNEVWWEIGRIRDRLTTRSREMNWLKMSLGDFQKSNGLYPDGPARLDPGRTEQASCRFSIEGDGDLERMLQANPPKPDQFRSAQASRSPFTGWNERYCDAFLYPLTLLDDLSPAYEKLPSVWSLQRPEERTDRAEKLTELIGRQGNFPAGMQWASPAGEAAADPESYCVLPETWRDLPKTLVELRDHGFPESRVVDAPGEDRAYLFRVQFGLAPARLREQEPR